MASGSSYTDMEEEANCPICWEFLTDPVTLNCGHSFCRGCITCYCDTWEELGVLKCPFCKAEIQKGNFRTNWQLANLVKNMKEKRFHSRYPGTEESDDPHEAAMAAGKERVCQKHQEPLKLFCKEEEALICLVCDRSKEHRDHETLPLEAASQEYKDQFCNHMEILKEERERIVRCKVDLVEESQDLLRKTTGEKQEVVAKFRQQHSFLEDQEKLLLALIEEVENEVETTRDQRLAELSEELSSVDSLIQEMQEKCQQLASDLLQDARNTLQRYEEKEAFENPVTFPLALKWRISEYSIKNFFLEGIMNRIRDALLSGLCLQIADVTLDPDTAHPYLILSEDGKSVRQGEEAQAMPNNPERFDSFCAVLGREGFTAGSLFWEVLVGSEGGWWVGVARKSVRRKGWLNFSPEEGIWAVEKWEGNYLAARKGFNLPLTLRGEPKRIRVCLNYDGGQVAFFDANRAALIYEYSGASFSGETLLPFFYVYKKGHLRLC